MREFIDYVQAQETEVGEPGGELVEPQNYVMPPQEGKEESSEIGIIRELSPLKILARVRENLKGRFYDEETKEYKKLEGYEPLLNDYGISKYIAILMSSLNDVVTMSNIPPDEVNKLVRFVCRQTIPVMYINYKEWGVKIKSDLQLLSNQILMMTYGALHKGSGAGDRNVVRGTITESMVTRQGYPNQYPQKEGGFLSRMNPFAK